MILLTNRVNYDNVELGLKIAITDNIQNDELQNKIEEILEKESNGQVFDIDTTIEDEKLGEADVKLINLTMKKGLLNNKLYSTEKKKFKIVLIDKVNANKDVEIMGLGDK